MFLLPIIAPMTTVSAQLQFRADDFGILLKLDEVLAEREARINDISVITEANQALDQVRLEVRESDGGDPLARLDGALDGVTMQPTAPPPVMHPDPYDMMLNPDNHPDEWAENMWGTLLTVDNFIVWVHYRSRGGLEYDAYEEVDYAESSFILGLLGLVSGNDPLLHEVDVDGDGSEDVRVGLTVAVDEQDGWGLDGNPPTVLWAEPAIEFTVVAIDPNDPLWGALELLEVTLMKQFAYSLNPLGQGESYVWVIDSRFTMVPEDFSLEGKLLIIDHGQGISSTFIHLSKILVAPGQEVETGQPIAEVGATGRATGPHLDWRMNWHGQRLDPALLVGPMPSELAPVSE